MSEKKNIDKLNKFLKKMYKISLDQKYKAMLKSGNTPVAVVAVPKRDLLMVSSPVIDLPEENLLPLFRKLLTLNLKETHDAAFAINEEAGTIDLQIKRPLEHLDYSEFQRAIHAVASVTKKYNNILANDFDSKVVLLHTTKAGNWNRYLSALNPFTSFEPRVNNRQRIRKLRTIFSVLGIFIAIASGVLTYTETQEWALGIFVFLWTQFLVARAIPDLITDAKKIRRFIFFTLHPAIGVAILLGAYELWEIWWLSALLGYVGGLFLGRIVAAIILPQITFEEDRDDKERRKAWVNSQGSGG